MNALDRAVPRLDLNALNARLENASPLDVIAAGLAAFPGRIAAVSSFGTESAVLLHMIAQVDQATPILFLDTGHLFACRSAASRW